MGEIRVLIVVRPTCLACHSVSDQTSVIAVKIFFIASISSG